MLDTVRHSTQLHKMAQLDLPDTVYNWLVNFFKVHQHCTKYNNRTSSLTEISASVIHGSGIGPASCVVNASDMKTVTPGYSLCKYADNTYIILPASNVDSRVNEIHHIDSWAKDNNLKLNRQKS